MIKTLQVRADSHKHGRKQKVNIIIRNNYLNTTFFIVDPGDDAQTTICGLGKSSVGQANIPNDLDNTFSNTYTGIHDALSDFFKVLQAPKSRRHYYYNKRTGEEE